MQTRSDGRINSDQCLRKKFPPPLTSTRAGAWLGAVFRDGLFQFAEFLARQQADLAQFFEMLLRAGEVVRHQIGFTYVLVSSAVAGVQRECAIVVLERKFKLPHLAVGEPE